MPKRSSASVSGMQPQLGRRLRELRDASGLALQDVAAQTGVSKSFLSLVEMGKSDLSVARFMRVCEFYGVKPSEVLAGAPSSDPEHFRSPDEGSEIVMLRPPEAGSALLPTMTIYKPGAVTETFTHPGEVGDDAEYWYPTEGAEIRPEVWSMFEEVARA